MDQPTAIEIALRELLTAIDLNTDCKTNQIDRAALDPFVDEAFITLADGWQPDETHPANLTFFADVHATQG